MKALVCVKRVVDYNVKIRVKPDNSAVDLANVKMSMNPFDEIAVEEAIRMKEAGIVEEIVAVSLGEAKSQETIRTALAMGADRGIHNMTDLRTDQEVTPLAVAKLMKEIVGKESPDMVILGKQAIDEPSSFSLSCLLHCCACTFVPPISHARRYQFLLFQCVYIEPGHVSLFLL